MSKVKLRHLSRSEIVPAVNASRFVTAETQVTELAVKKEKFCDGILGVSHI